MSNIINGSDIQVLYDISKEISKYADSLREDIHRLVSKHRQIGNSWSGNQYDDFTEIIESARKKLETQAQRLIEISSAVKKDADLLSEANNYKPRS